MDNDSSEQDTSLRHPSGREFIIGLAEKGIAKTTPGQIQSLGVGKPITLGQGEHKGYVGSIGQNNTVFLRTVIPTPGGLYEIADRGVPGLAVCDEDDTRTNVGFSFTFIRHIKRKTVIAFIDIPNPLAPKT
jgi:hypothetical protein